MAIDVPMIRVTVAFAKAPRIVEVCSLEVPLLSTVEIAIARSGLLKGLQLEKVQPLEFSVWGRKASLSHRLRQGDRIEITRPLLVDPKVARRERFARQGARTTGLFANKKAAEK